MRTDDQRYRPATPGRLAAMAVAFTCSWLATWLRIVVAAHIPSEGALVGFCVLLGCDALFVRWAFSRLARRRAEYERDPAAFVAQRAAAARVAGTRSRWLLWVLWAVLWSAGALIAGAALVSTGSSAAVTAGTLLLLILGPLGDIACVVLGIRSFRRGRRLTTAPAALAADANTQW